MTSDTTHIPNGELWKKVTIVIIITSLWVFTSNAVGLHECGRVQNMALHKVLHCNFCRHMLLFFVHVLFYNCKQRIPFMIASRIPFEVTSRGNDDLEVYCLVLVVAVVSVLSPRLLLLLWVSFWQDQSWIHCGFCVSCPVSTAYTECSYSQSPSQVGEMPLDWSTSRFCDDTRNITAFDRFCLLQPCSGCTDWFKVVSLLVPGGFHCHWFV